MVLASNEDRPFDDVDCLGVAACKVSPVYEGQNFGIHVALLYRTDGNPARLAHLAWHFLHHPGDPPDARFRWAQIPLDSINASFVASWLEDRWEKPELIPYGFSVTGDVWDQGTDTFIPPPCGEGLTCATFILGTMRHLRLPIVQEDTWPYNRAEDLTWQAGIINMLEKHGAAADHVAALKNNVGAVRFRPEEVCGAAILPDWPITFDDASTLAAEIVQLIGSCQT